MLVGVRDFPVRGEAQILPTRLRSSIMCFRSTYLDVFLVDESGNSLTLTRARARGETHTDKCVRTSELDRVSCASRIITRAVMATVELMPYKSAATQDTKAELLY